MDEIDEVAERVATELTEWHPHVPVTAEELLRDGLTHYADRLREAGHKPPSGDLPPLPERG